MSSRRRLVWLSMAVVPMLFTLGCGAGDDSLPDDGLSAAGLNGRATALAAGCSSCHGKTGTGGVGPSWVGLAGSTRTLVDGSEVVADRDYLTRSITDPSAQRVEGYSITMPAASLTEAEVASIVGYLEELG